MVKDVQKMGDEEIREVVEAREMVMQAEEWCSQAERLSVRMTGCSVMLFWAGQRPWCLMQ